MKRPCPSKKTQSSPKGSWPFPAEGAVVSAGDLIFSWNGSDVGSGIDHFEIRLDGGSYLNLGTNTPHLSAGIPDGRHEVGLKAVDGAGNVHEQRVTFVASSARLGDDLL